MKFYKLNETLKFFKDSLTKPKRPVYEDKEFEDSHVHFPIPKSRGGLEKIFSIIFEKVDRCAMTSWGDAVERSWKYENFINDVADYKGKFEVRVNGVVTHIKYGDKEVLIVKSQENYTKQGVHITSEGCEKTFPQELDVGDLIERIQANGGNSYIEHMGTKNFPILKYWYVNERELEFIKSLFPYVDGVEVFNSTNSLWMSISNSIAKKIVGEYNKEGRKITPVAGSDTHFYPKLIGHAGVYLPKHDLKGLTGKEIIALKKKDLKGSEILLYEHYLDPIEFFISMVLNPYKVN